MSQTASATKDTTQEQKGGALVDIRDQIRKELERTRKTVAPPSTNRISTNGKRFNMPNGQTHQGPLQAVILDHRNFNLYYTKPYDANNPVPPDCFAIAKEFDGLSPNNHEGAKSPQADSCATCPRNEWKSAPNGKGKACRNMVRLALATPDGDDEVLTLNLPPTSLKHWSRLVNDLETVGKLPIQAVVEISFDEGVAYPVPTFKVVNSVDELETFWALREKAQAVLDQEPSVDG